MPGVENKKRILFLIFSLEKGGGTERVVADQLNNLNKNNSDLFLCVLGNNVDLGFLGLIRIPEENKKIFNFGSLFDISSWLSFIYWLRKEKFDVLYSHLFFANFVGRIAGGIVGIKRIITTEHNVYLSRGFLERFANRILSNISYQVIAVSNSVKDYLIKYEKISPDKITLIYNGVDLEKYTYRPAEREDLRQKLGLQENDFAILSIGQVNIQKNYDLIIDIAKEIKEKNQGIKFFIAGGDKGSLADKLKKRISEEGLVGRVNFLGVRDDVAALLSASDVFMMPSYWEGFGLALVEAMANGKPVLVNNINTLREIVGENGHYGLIATKPEEFSDTIIKLKEDKEFYTKYANLSLQRSKDFSLDKNISQISKLIL